MRGLTLLASCLLLAGCSSGPLDDPGRVFEQSPQSPDLDTVEKIEIAAGQAPGIPGPAVSYDLVLVKVGRCRATVTHGTNFNSDNKTITHYELPSEMFDECRALLKETDFFRMQSSARPEVPFENGLSSVSVTCGGRMHAVNVITPEKAAEGYDKLYNFVTGAEKRGKEVNKTGPLPPEAPPAPK